MAWRFDVSRSTLRGKGALKNDEPGGEAPRRLSLALFNGRDGDWRHLPTGGGLYGAPACLDVQPGHIVADLCAAPGSKTQQIIEAINPPRPRRSLPSLRRRPSGVVIANDMDYNRGRVDSVRRAQAARARPH